MPLVNFYELCQNIWLFFLVFFHSSSPRTFLRKFPIKYKDSPSCFSCFCLSFSSSAIDMSNDELLLIASNAAPGHSSHLTLPESTVAVNCCRAIGGDGLLHLWRVVEPGSWTLSDDIIIAPWSFRLVVSRTFPAALMVDSGTRELSALTPKGSSSCDLKI